MLSNGGLAARAGEGKMKRFSSVLAASAVLLFSCSSLAEQNTLMRCSGDNQQEYNEYKTLFYEKDPGNVEKIYDMSVSAICIKKMQEGMALLERAADGGHVQANYYMGVYHEKDRSFDLSKPFTEDPENYNAMLFYYNRAADLIDNNPQYPEGATIGAPESEQKNRISARVFTALPDSYYSGYSTAINKIIGGGERTEYVDTLEVLEKMRSAAENCLERPSLAVWRHRRSEVGHSMQVRCGAYRGFAESVLPLEEERLTVARQCTVPLKECSEHQNVIDALTDLADTMRENVRSAPSL